MARTQHNHVERISSAVQTPLSAGASPGSGIVQSWRRCMQTYGIHPADNHKTVVLTATELKELQDKLELLLFNARDEMRSLYQQIGAAGYSVILTDHLGVIADYIGDPNYDRLFRGAGLWLGALWDEEQESTNGIGTCAAEQQAVTIHRDHHFRSNHTGLSCSAAPIFDSAGNLLAVLDASTVNTRQCPSTAAQTLQLAHRVRVNRAQLCGMRSIVQKETV